MSFTSQTYQGLISSHSLTQDRLFSQYKGSRTDFDIIIIGSGMGGGILADDLTDQTGHHKRILVLEAGSYLFPTHVFNVCRFPNASVAANFKVKTFYQYGHGNSEHYIHEEPQLNLGGRSIFWSGLIPDIQPWELDFFPDQVKNDLASQFLQLAGQKMNESVSMGKTARAIVEQLRQSQLAADFEIRETPRALHQPYLQVNGEVQDESFVEPTGVFNTAELLINQIGLPGSRPDHHSNGLHLLLNHYVEDIQQQQGDLYQLIVRNTLNNQIRAFQAPKVVLAAGSIDSPKLLNRSSLVHSLPGSVRFLIGRGLTDHPTTDWVGASITHIDDVPVPRNSHAKIVFYSKGKRDSQNQIRYPFNVEMNINHEYWHLRENDPSDPAQSIYQDGSSILEIKFSFANCLDDGNEIKPAPPYGYVPEIVFKNLHWTSHLTHRFSALAGWNKSDQEIFGILNDITRQIFSRFSINGQPVSPNPNHPYGQNFVDFGFGTVHHAVGTLRMPYKSGYQKHLNYHAVVDENLKVNGTNGLFVCDMSVLPFSSAANPVRTLSALAVRLARHLNN
jgi:choline dehydrogenase-like flavoprotein